MNDTRKHYSLSFASRSRTSIGLAYATVAAAAAAADAHLTLISLVHWKQDVRKERND